jgi:hypothetical protein
MLQALSLVAIALTKKLTLRCGISIPAIAFGLKPEVLPRLDPLRSKADTAMATSCQRWFLPHITAE